MSVTYRHLGYDSYEAYLGSTHWASVKRLFKKSELRQDCQGLRPSGRCGSTVVQLHHWTYERLGQEELGDLVPLCDECHERIHEICENVFDSGRLRQATHIVCGLGPWSTKKQRKAARRQQQMTTPEVRRIKPLAAELVVEGALRAEMYAMARPDRKTEGPGYQPKTLDKWSQASLKARRPNKSEKERRRLAA